MSQGATLHQKMAAAVAESTAAVQLTAQRPDHSIQAGDTVLCRHSASHSALAVLPDPLAPATAGQELPVTSCPQAPANMRTGWTLEVVPPSAKDELSPRVDEAGRITYGTPLRLRIKLLNNMVGYLCSQQLSLTAPAARFSGKQRVFVRCVDGSTPTTDQPAASLGGETVWTLVYGDQHLRFEHEGQAVDTRHKIMLRHVRTGQCIAVHTQHPWPSAYGLEHEVAAHVYYNPHKHEDDANMLTLELA